MFERRRKVRFSQTDYAGIMFYPRYFEMVNAVVEDWFDEELGFSFPTMLDDVGVGTPLGSISTRFVAPCRLGDILTFTLSVAELSDKTVTLEIEAKCDNELRAVSKLTHVCVSADISGATKWPSEISEKISKAKESTV